MKQGIVKFSKEFITPTGLKEWAGLEWPIDVPFDEVKAMETFLKVKEFVCNSQPKLFQDNSMPPGPPPIINVQRTSEDNRIAELVRDIYACTEIDGDSGLLSYKKLASANREVQNVFDIMFMKLTRPIPEPSKQ